MVFKKDSFFSDHNWLAVFMKRHKVEQSFGSAFQSSRKNDPMVLTVHRCKFVNYMPASVQCMALSPPTAAPFLAVGKSDNSIELWNMSDRNDFFLERVIPGGTDLSVESICWSLFGCDTKISDVSDDSDFESDISNPIGNISEPANLSSPALARLFSAGLKGQIIEWDLETLSPGAVSESYGGPIWSMSLSRNGCQLAVGCEDGCIKLFNLNESVPGITYCRSFSPQQDRILSLTWSPDNKLLASGSSNSLIRVWDVSSGRTLQRMSVERIEESPTLVWCVLYLNNSTIVSGDSLGHTQFWDINTGTLIRSFVSHESDILTLAANPEGTIVFAAGVDYKISQFKLLEGVSMPISNAAFTSSSISYDSSISGSSFTAATWMPAGHRRCHTHDVRSLVYAPLSLASPEGSPLLISGGIDTTIIIHNVVEFPKKLERKLTSLPQVNPVVQLAKEGRRVLVQDGPSHLQLWALDSGTDGNNFALDMRPRCQLLFDVRLPSSNAITVSAISPDGRYFAASTQRHLRIFSQQSHVGSLFWRRLQDTLDCLQPAKLLHFFHFNNVLYLACISFTNCINILKLEDDIPVLIATKNPFLFSSLSEDRFINCVSIDPSGTYLAFSTEISVLIFRMYLNQCLDGDHDQLCLLERIHSGKFRFHDSKIEASFVNETISLVRWHPSLPMLIVATVQKTFLLYNIKIDREVSPSETFSLHPWSNDHADKLRLFWKSAFRDKIVGISLSSSYPSLFLFWGVHFMVWFDISQPFHATKYFGRKEVSLGQDRPRILNGSSSFDGPLESNNSCIHLSRAYKPLLYCGYLQDGSLAVVERPWLSILKELPLPFQRIRYGQ